MFRLKLSEMEDEGYDDMQEDMEREGIEDEYGYEMGQQKPSVDVQQSNSDKMTDPDGTDLEEMTLDEILAELELEEGLEDDYEDAVDDLDDGDALEEGHVAGYTAVKMDKKEPQSDKTRGGDHAYSKAVKSEAKKDDDKDAEEADDAEEATEEAEGEVAELSVEEFKNLVRDIVADVMGGKTQPEEGGEEDLEGGEDMTVTADEEGDETISLDEILAEIGLMEGKKKMVMKKDDKKKEDKKKEDEKKEKEDLKEAIRTIHVLKAQLNELNLLNAKLLYVNKLYKAKNLNEGQKVKVLAAFDRATTINEAKNIYATLKDSLQVNAPVAKGQLKESLGFASKPIGSAPARPIVEADSYVYRMQQLAGIKKPNI
jgi:hypothetical protein